MCNQTVSFLHIQKKQSILGISMESANLGAAAKSFIYGYFLELFRFNSVSC